jgi:hypothetical protein
MDSENVAQNKKNKKPFVLYRTPAWLLVSQNWISDGARKLYLAMRSLADQRTGELAIPGRGNEERWIKPKTIDRKAGMSDETRMKYMRELISLGAVQFERKPVKRTIKNRLRKVRGVSRYTLLPLKPPIANIHAGSTTAKNQQSEESEPQDGVSTTAKSTTAKGENGLLQPNSSTVEEFGSQDLSKPTTGAAVPSRDAVAGSSFESSDRQGSRQSTTTKPATALSPEIENKKQELVQRFIIFLCHDQQENKLGEIGIEEHFDIFRKKANALAIPWSEIQTLWARILQSVFPSAPGSTPAPPTQTEPDEPIFGHISPGMVRMFWEHADRFGWSRQQTRDYLRSFFQVESPKHLSLQDYHIALQRVHHSPMPQTETSTRRRCLSG